MDKQTFLNTMEHVKKGTFKRLVTESTVKTTDGSNVVKHSEVTCKIGISYDGINAVKKARETGILPKVNAGLNGKQFISYPLLMEGKNSNLLTTVATYRNSNRRTVYYRNGVVVDYDTLVKSGIIKEAKKHESVLDGVFFYTPNIDNIISIG